MPKSTVKTSKELHPIRLSISVTTRDRIAYALAKHNLENPGSRLNLNEFEIVLLEQGLKQKEAQLKIRHAL